MGTGKFLGFCTNCDGLISSLDLLVDNDLKYKCFRCKDVLLVSGLNSSLPKYDDDDDLDFSTVSFNSTPEEFCNIVLPPSINLDDFNSDSIISS